MPLQQDGRRTYARIGAAVGLSEAAVRQRVTRLIDSGVIQIVAVTDPMQIGLHRQAMVGVRTEGDITEVADQLVALEQVEYVVITAGSFDLLVEVVCADDEELLDVVGTQISCLPGVVATETFVYLKLRKQTYTWSTGPGRAEPAITRTPTTAAPEPHGARDGSGAGRRRDPPHRATSVRAL